MYQHSSEIEKEDTQIILEKSQPQSTSSDKLEMDISSIHEAQRYTKKKKKNHIFIKVKKFNKWIFRKKEIERSQDLFSISEENNLEKKFVTQRKTKHQAYVKKKLKKNKHFIFRLHSKVTKFLSFKRQKQKEEYRLIYLNSRIISPNNYSCSNKIHSHKYTWITFIPLSFYEQFRRLANFYFLFLIVLQSLPQLSSIHPVLAALPLTIIIGCTIAKDGFEDWKRRKNDWHVNHQKTCLIVSFLPIMAMMNALIG